MDFGRMHAATAADFAGGVRHKRVLVIGCNVGHDCAYFVELGAATVTGLDVIAKTGSEYSHSAVNYVVASAELMPFADESFDLVYSFATLEHVPRIDAAFSEISRVTSSGGLAYSVASPLWNSPQGHHKSNFFEDVPWIHLRMSAEEILIHCVNRGLSDSSGIAMRAHVEYMLDDRYFNKVSAMRYVEVCKALPGMLDLYNWLDLESEALLTDGIWEELRRRGYDRQNLLAVTHTFVGLKARTTRLVYLRRVLHRLRIRLSRRWRRIKARISD